jgi:hypothetical protein
LIAGFAEKNKETEQNTSMAKSTGIFKIIILLLSIVSGFLYFFCFGKNDVKLLIDMKTSVGGFGQVYWNSGNGYSEKESVQFQLKTDNKSNRYEIILPRLKLHEIRIDPFQAIGDFEIKSITLNNAYKEYVWADGKLARDLKVLQNVKQDLSQSNVFAGSSIAPDISLILKDIPEEVFFTPIKDRLLKSIYTFLVVFGGLILLLDIIIFISTRIKIGSSYSCLLKGTLYLFLVALYLFHFYYIISTAVNVPHWDEWNYFLPDGMTTSLNWHWLFSFHNEHRIPLTKLISWILLKINGLNFITQETLNYLIFGILLLSMCSLRKNILGKGEFVCFPLVLICLLSPLNYENHSWGFQSQIHFVILFSVLAIIFSFSEEGWKRNILFAFFTILTIYSFSSGVVVGVIYVSLFSMFYALRIVRNIQLEKANLYSAIFAVVAITISIFLWFKGYHKPSHHPPLSLPSSAEFWGFFLNIISFGFGFKSQSLWTGFICFLFTIIPFVCLVFRRGELDSQSYWKLLAGTSAIFSALVAISMGRGAFGLQQAKASHYNELSYLLIVFTTITIWYLLNKSPGKRTVVLLSLLLFCLGGYARDWSFNIYDSVMQKRLISLEVFSRYYHGIGNGNCATSYSENLAPYLDRAKQLNVSFTRGIQ